MRKLVPIGLVVAAVAGAAAPATATDRPRVRSNPAGRVTARVPAGWQQLHGWLSDVEYPIPAIAVASFPVQLSRHSCECGMPNVKHFPRDGAFLFVWEWSNETRRQLARVPDRVPNSIPPAGAPQRYECQGPTSELSLRRGGAALQVELYIGPDASRSSRAELMAILRSLRVADASASR